MGIDSNVDISMPHAKDGLHLQLVKVLLTLPPGEGNPGIRLVSVLPLPTYTPGGPGGPGSPLSPFGPSGP